MALPEIRLLQAAIAIAEYLNFSRAAERLHLTQPALSKQIVEQCVRRKTLSICFDLKRGVPAVSLDLIWESRSAS
jgi:hypothetical protein